MSEATKHGIKKLTDYQHARLKTEMYLGSRVPHTQSVLLFNENGPYIKETTWTPAAFTAFREALDNATDEVIGHKHGDKLWIDYDEAAKTISVKDNGRGIPIDFDKTHDMHVATMVLTQARAGRNFGDRGQVGGTNGLGIAVVAFCSEWFEVEIVTAGKRFNQRFSETMFDELGIDEPTIKAFKGETGTKVTFKLSDEVFNSNGNSLILPEEFISSRAYELSLVNPGVTVFYNGQKIKKPTYFNKNNSFEITLDEDMILPDGTKKHYFSKFIIAPNFVEEGDFFNFFFVQS